MDIEAESTILNFGMGKPTLNVDQMLKERNCETRNAEVLHFSVEGVVRRVSKPIEGNEDSDDLIAAEVTTVYNPTKPISPGLIAGRKELLASEIGNVDFFLEESQANFVPALEGKTFVNAQDPSFTPGVKGFNIFTINKIETDDQKNITSVREQLFKLNEQLEGLETPFAEGPEGMKCIRLTMWPDGKIGIFTRPQGGHAGRGKIGYIEVNELDEVQNAIPEANILDDVFDSEEWGGVNDVINLDTNHALAIAHIARFKTATVKEYFALATIFDRENKCFKGTQIIATAEDFPSAGKPKNETLGSVIYPGGATLQEDGWITLYGGVGDTATFRKDINIQPVLDHA